MKIKNLAIAAFCTIALSACSPTEDAPTVKTLQPKHGLIGKLVQVNDSLKSQYLSRGLVNEGDAPTQLDENWVSIAWADAKGARTGWKIGSTIGMFAGGPSSSAVLGTLGGILVGGTRSMIKYHKLNTPLTSIDKNISNFVAEIIKTNEIYDPEFMYKAQIYSSNTISRSAKKLPNIIYKDTLFRVSEKIGIEHNAIIENIAINPDIKAIRRVLIPNNENTSLINSADFRSAYRTEISKIISDTSTMEEDDQAITAQILQLYRTAIKNCPDKANDISFIVNLYIDEIFNSNELSAEERAEVYSAIAVGAYSIVLWEDKLDINN